MLVEFTLSAEGPERTRLRVTETGLEATGWSDDDKARYAEDHRDGWSRHLGDLESLLGGARDDLGEGIAVLVGVLGEQSGEVAFQRLATLAPPEMDTERFEELGQFGHRSPRGVRNSGGSHALNYEFDSSAVQLTK